MKRIIGLMILTLAIVGCQKAPTESRIGSTDARANSLLPGATTTPSGITLNGKVTSDSSYQTQFEQAVKDFLEGSMNPNYVGMVSSQGSDQTGVFVGGKIALQTGQALYPINNGRVDITPTSELFVAVYDKFQDQSNLAPIPPVYLKQSSGYVSGNNIYIDFWDGYGSVHLEGTFDHDYVRATFEFKTTRTYDGRVGYSEPLGDLQVPTCQFFRCQ